MHQGGLSQPLRYPMVCLLPLGFAKDLWASSICHSITTTHFLLKISGAQEVGVEKATPLLGVCLATWHNWEEILLALLSSQSFPPSASPTSFTLVWLVFRELNNHAYFGLLQLFSSPASVNWHDFFSSLNASVRPYTSRTGIWRAKKKNLCRFWCVAIPSSPATINPHDFLSPRTPA